jgi:hypothetical protein
MTTCLQHSPTLLQTHNGSEFAKFNRKNNQTRRTNKRKIFDFQNKRLHDLRHSYFRTLNRNFSRHHHKTQQTAPFSSLKYKMRLVALFTSALAAISSTAQDYIWLLEGDAAPQWVTMARCNLPTPACVSAGRNLAVEAHAMKMKAYWRLVEKRIEWQRAEKAVKIDKFRRKAAKLSEIFTKGDVTFIEYHHHYHLDQEQHNPCVNKLVPQVEMCTDAEFASAVAKIGPPPTSSKHVKGFDNFHDFFYENWYHSSLLFLIWAYGLYLCISGLAYIRSFI